MSLAFSCPHCGAQIDVSPAQTGWQMKCPQCRTPVSIPAVEGASPPPPPAEIPAGDHPDLLVPKRRAHNEDLIDMTAMVDIVFFLLIFFLVTSMQQLEAVIGLPAPQAEETEGGKSTRVADMSNDTANFITLVIDEENAIWLDGEEIFGEQSLRVKLRAARGGERKGLLVIGSAKAHHGALVMVLDAGADAGIDELVFSVREQVDADDS